MKEFKGFYLRYIKSVLYMLISLSLVVLLVVVAVSNIRPIDDDVEVEDPTLDPQNVLENREQVDALMNDIKLLLSEFELKALTLYLGGGSYESIAKSLGTTSKSVDNALQRARLKLKNRI